MAKANNQAKDAQNIAVEAALKGRRARLRGTAITLRARQTECRKYHQRHGLNVLFCRCGVTVSEQRTFMT
jgi:hypothetical protein